MNYLEAVLNFFKPGGWLFDQIDALNEMLKGFYQFLPEILVIAVGLIVLFFGKKILPLEKILLFLVVGFTAGFVVVADLVSGWISFDLNETVQIVVGCVIALVCVLLFKPLYYIAVIGGVGAGGYFGGMWLIENVEAIKNFADSQANLNYILAGAVALVAVIIVLCLLKYIEMLVTSAIGAVAVAVGAVRIYDYASLVDIGAIELGGVQVAISMLVVAAVLFLIGFIVQVKTRRLY